MGTKIRWTGEMIAQLKQRYAEEGAETLAPVLGVTMSAVHHQAARMGIVYKYPGKAAHAARLFWTPEREEMLRQRYPGEGPQLLAQELGKSIHAVVIRASQLGLGSTHHYERVRDANRHVTVGAYALGVYGIRHRDGRLYIGSARNIAERWLRHKRDLERGIHSTVRLQQAWNQDGETAFELVILDVGKWKRAERTRIEQRWIDEKNSCHPDFGFNTKVAVDGSSARQRDIQ